MNPKDLLRKNLESLTVPLLRNHIKKYNLHVKIKGYSTMKKKDLVENLLKHLEIDTNKSTYNNIIKVKVSTPPNLRNFKKLHDISKSEQKEWNNIILKSYLNFLTDYKKNKNKKVKNDLFNKWLQLTKTYSYSNDKKYGRIIDIDNIIDNNFDFIISIVQKYSTKEDYKKFKKIQNLKEKHYKIINKKSFDDIYKQNHHLVNKKTHFF